jgi:hypothetical protein
MLALFQGGVRLGHLGMGGGQARTFRDGMGGVKPGCLEMGISGGGGGVTLEGLVKGFDRVYKMKLNACA